jgi:sortase (surface protein transpeptidase)
MPNLVQVKYAQTGKSKKTNALGMREMQERAYDARTAYDQHNLLGEVEIPKISIDYIFNKP